MEKTPWSGAKPEQQPPLWRCDAAGDLPGSTLVTMDDPPQERPFVF
jgi:hypothetical protein